MAKTLIICMPDVRILSTEADAIQRRLDERLPGVDVVLIPGATQATLVEVEDPASELSP